MPALIEDRVWAGSEASLQAAIAGEEARAARIAAGHDWGQPEDEEELPRLLEIQDGVAFINIKGTLNNSGDAWWNDYIGATGYPEIRDAMVSAAQHADVQHIVLDIDSGGGAVAGLADTASLIRLVHDKVKPVTAFAGGNMYSAAYWLGSSAGKVLATVGSGVGSIGVIATHMERSKMLKDAGIGVTVIRAGKYKALASSVEPLSKEGEAQIQAGVDVAYKIFTGHVSAMRGKSIEYVDSVMAQGREFYGQAAVDAGLVDSLSTFDAMVSEIKKKLIDPSANSMDNRGKQNNGLRTESQGDAVMAGKKTLTEADIAALAAGVTLDAAAPPVDANAEAARVAAEAAEAERVAAEAAEAEAAAKPNTDEVDTSAQTLKFVSDQLKASQDDLLAARIALSKAEDKVAELSAVVSPLKDIAAKAVNNMRVACNSAVMDFSALNATQVLAEYQSVTSTFQAQYKAGGVSATTATAGKEVANEQKVDARTQARLNAVRFPTK